jgi:hypothetical protein
MHQRFSAPLPRKLRRKMPKEILRSNQIEQPPVVSCGEDPKAREWRATFASSTLCKARLPNRLTHRN